MPSSNWTAQALIASLGGVQPVLPCRMLRDSFLASGVSLLLLVNANARVDHDMFESRIILKLHANPSPSRVRL